MGSSEQSMRRVTAIRNGTVIDHVPAGQALLALQVFGIDGKNSSPVSLVMNVPSGKHGNKDIIKIEDRELTQEELDKLALIAPHASVAIIRNYSVAEKRNVHMGEEVVNVAKCSFMNCITRGVREPLPHRLKVISTESFELRCHYCGRIQDLDTLVENLI